MDTTKMTIGEALERKAEMEESRNQLDALTKILQCDEKLNANVSKPGNFIDASKVTNNASRLLNAEIKELDKRIKNAVLS